MDTGEPYKWVPIDGRAIKGTVERATRTLITWGACSFGGKAFGGVASLHQYVVKLKATQELLFEELQSVCSKQRAKPVSVSASTKLFGKSFMR